MCIRIYRHNNVYIASAVRRDRSGHVDSADIDIERLIDADLCLLLLDLCLDTILVQDAHLVGISLDCFLNNACESFVIDACSDFSVQQGLSYFLNRLKLFQIRRLPDHFLYIVQHKLIVLLIQSCLCAELIIFCIQYILCVVIFPHDNDHVVSLISRPSYVGKHPIGAVYIVSCNTERYADQYAQNYPQDKQFIFDKLKPEHNAEEN